MSDKKDSRRKVLKQHIPYVLNGNVIYVGPNTQWIANKFKHQFGKTPDTIQRIKLNKAGLFAVV